MKFNNHKSHFVVLSGLFTALLLSTMGAPRVNERVYLVSIDKSRIQTTGLFNSQIGRVKAKIPGITAASIADSRYKFIGSRLVSPLTEAERFAYANLKYEDAQKKQVQAYNNAVKIWDLYQKIPNSRNKTAADKAVKLYHEEVEKVKIAYRISQNAHEIRNRTQKIVNASGKPAIKPADKIDLRIKVRNNYPDNYNFSQLNQVPFFSGAIKESQLKTLSVPTDPIIDANADGRADVDHFPKYGSVAERSRWWAQELIGVPTARQAGLNGMGIVIAVLDTGIDLKNIDFGYDPSKPHLDPTGIFVNKGEIPGNGIDDDGNGYIDDYYGYNFHEARKDISANGVLNPAKRAKYADPSEDRGSFHGTSVAAIMSAKTNNQFGLAGVAPEAQILPVKIAGGEGSAYSGDIAGLIEGINYAVSRGVDIINLSVGFDFQGSNITSPGFVDPLSAALENARNAGVIVVVAAANAGQIQNSNSRPSAHPSVFGIGGSNFGDNGFYAASNRGANIKLLAPAEEIRVTLPGEVAGYNPNDNNAALAAGRIQTNFPFSQGNSYASSLVSGSVALMLQKKKIPADQILSAFIRTGKTIGDAKRIDVGRALNEIQVPNPPTGFRQNPTNVYDVNNDGRVTPLDALLVINFIGRKMEGAIPGAFYDVTGDGTITPLDALRVINEIGRQGQSVN